VAVSVCLSAARFVPYRERSRCSAKPAASRATPPITDGRILRQVICCGGRFLLDFPVCRHRYRWVCLCVVDDRRRRLHRRQTADTDARSRPLLAPITRSSSLFTDASAVSATVSSLASLPLITLCRCLRPPCGSSGTSSSAISSDGIPQLSGCSSWM